MEPYLETNRQGQPILSLASIAKFMSPEPVGDHTGSPTRRSPVQVHSSTEFPAQHSPVKTPSHSSRPRRASLEEEMKDRLVIDHETPQAAAAAHGGRGPRPRPEGSPISPHHTTHFTKRSRPDFDLGGHAVQAGASFFHDSGRPPLTPYSNRPATAGAQPTPLNTRNLAVSSPLVAEGSPSDHGTPVQVTPPRDRPISQSLAQPQFSERTGPEVSPVGTPKQAWGSAAEEESKTPRGHSPVRTQDNDMKLAVVPPPAPIVTKALLRSISNAIYSSARGVRHLFKRFVSLFILLSSHVLHAVVTAGI